MSVEPLLIYYPGNDRYCVELDPNQVFPDDPGQGTPVMVRYMATGQSACATYNCAINEGELLDDQDRPHPLPDSVIHWLIHNHSVQAAIETTFDVGEQLRRKA